MSQPSTQPGLLSPEAVQLIDGQYADRLHLRPVLDAVLAALPALGPVTVEARRTLVSLVTPRARRRSLRPVGGRGHGQARR